MNKELKLLPFTEEESRTTIECGSCEYMETIQDESLYAVEVFYQNGWRVRKGICYCPMCSKEL